MNGRPFRIHHATSMPCHFVGRSEQLLELSKALNDGHASVVALIGPGGQGKTAILQHWLSALPSRTDHLEGAFFWSFYRGKDCDLFLRELLAYVEDLPAPPEVSASYCVDRLLPRLRQQRWALLLDGTEVVQREDRAWFGRFVHPELGRLLQELATEPMPGCVVLTTRFPIPELDRRRHVHVISLDRLDPVTARSLLRNFGVRGSDSELDRIGEIAGRHAKAVELLGTCIRRWHEGEAAAFDSNRDASIDPDACEEERAVARVLLVFRERLSDEAKDILRLATAFRDPPRAERLVDYLVSPPVARLLSDNWRRSYAPFSARGSEWLRRQITELIELRLLECVPGGGETEPGEVIDAHPLVRRGFAHVDEPGRAEELAGTRAGFLRGRPDRRRPESLEQAREDVELFHAYCDAGLWNEADSAYTSLENPKHRLLAPALERDMLLRFFPQGDFRKPPLWPGFGRHRSLAISFEMLGQFEEALAAYPAQDAPLCGDALLALGRLEPLLNLEHVGQPWSTLWSAYRAHALALAGRSQEVVALLGALIPVDVYEWTHVFEACLRLGRLDALDMNSLFCQLSGGELSDWTRLAITRMRADYLRITGGPDRNRVEAFYRELIAEYDRRGLPLERGLTRLGYARWLQAYGRGDEAQATNEEIIALAERAQMRILAADAWSLQAELDELPRPASSGEANARAESICRATGYFGPTRP